MHALLSVLEPGHYSTRDSFPSSNNTYCTDICLREYCSVLYCTTIKTMQCQKTDVNCVLYMFYEDQ